MWFFRCSFVTVNQTQGEHLSIIIYQETSVPLRTHLSFTSQLSDPPPDFCVQLDTNEGKKIKDLKNQSSVAKTSVKSLCFYWVFAKWIPAPASRPAALRARRAGLRHPRGLTRLAAFMWRFELCELTRIAQEEHTRKLRSWSFFWSLQTLCVHVLLISSVGFFF